MTTLTKNDISNRIPHRHENILLDECNLGIKNNSQFNVHISDNDPFGRDIFLGDHKDNRVLFTPILTEIAALACIVSSGEISPGSFAYFAAITNFYLDNGPVKGGVTITGTTEKISEKNGFFKYRFSMSNSHQVAQGELMAFYDTTGSISDGSEPINLDPLLLESLTTQTKIPSYSTKANHMTFIDTLHYSSPNQALYGYSYPSTHPLIKGHFPGNPVMMGVCQWLLLEDAIAHYVSQQSTSDPQSLTCNAQIFKSNLTKVCDIKSANIACSFGNDQWHVHTCSVKKVMFKQRVSPNDQLFIHIFDISQQPLLTDG